MKKSYQRNNSITDPTKNNAFLKIAIILLFVFFGFQNIYSQGASCATAFAVNVNQPYTGSTSDTTVNDPTAPLCNGQAILTDGWVSFVAIGPEAIVTLTANRNPVLYAYSSCASPLPMSCANATTSNGNQTETLTLTGLSSGTTYYIRIGNTLSNTMTISSFSIVTNNQCSNAIALPCGTASLQGSTIGTANYTHGSGCTMANNGVWYTFTGDGYSTTISTTSTGFDIEMAIASGTCGSLSNIICRDLVINGTETHTFTTVVGTVYYVYVADFAAAGTNRGNFTISRSCVIPPANNDCGGAVALTVNPDPTCTTSTSGTTINATQSLAGCAGTADDDVWYTFVATGTSHTVTVTPTTLSDAVLEVFSGCGTGSFGCVNATTGTNAERTVLTGLTSGLTYYVRVYSSTNGSGQGTFSICVTSPPVNNDCSGAVALTVNPTGTCTTSGSGTTISATQSLAGCAGTADDDVWYTFVATGTSHTVTVTPTTLSDAILEVFSGCGTGSFGCVNATTGTNSETTTLTGLTLGVTYYVRVYSSANGSGQGTFSICVTSPPPNNDCGGAIALTVNSTPTCTTSTSGTSVSATQSLVGCAGTADDDVWYTFVATGTSHTVTVTPTTLSDAVLEVFSGCGTGSFGCVNATTGTNAERTILTGLTSGLTYYVRVYSSANGSGQGTFSICVTSPPVNNDCGGAVALTVNSTPTCTTSTSGTTISATQSLAGCAGTADDDVWYTFVATGTSHTVTVTPTTLSDAVLEVFSGCGTGSFGCVNATTGTNAETTILTGLTSGLTYYVRVYSNANGTGQGTFSICVTSPPPNNDCSGAVALTVNSTGICTTSTSGTTINASQTLAGCSGTADDDVWYSFVATGTYHTLTVTPTTLSDAVFEVFTASCGTGSLICVNSTTGSTAETTALTGLTSGATYYVRVYSSGNGTGQGTFSICVTTPLINDNCTGAIGLTVNPSSTCTTSTSGTTVGATQSLLAAGCSGTADDDVWYSFVATGTSHVVTVTPTGLTDAVFQLYTGTCGALGSGYCMDSTTGTNQEIGIYTGFTIGTTYYVRVHSYGNGVGQGNFNICITSPPSNNQCANAIDLPCGTSNLAGTTIGAANFAHGTACSLSTYGVWYKFTGDGNPNQIAVTTTSYDIEMAISSGTCGAFTNLACQDTVINGTESFIVNTVLGTTYYVYIADYNPSTAYQGNFTISRTCITPPLNDNCAGAISLTPVTVCNSTIYTNLGATATTGVTAPGCAAYSGGDVWFTAIVPANGELTVTLQAGTLTDSGMAFYSGSCGALTLLDCDNNGAAGAMSKITLTGLTVGQTIYIRVWGNGGTSGTFGICATTPSCASPSDLIATIVSSTSATVYWADSGAVNGYEYFYTTTNTPPVAGSTPNGTTAAGVVGVLLTGLTSGQIYYFWVRSVCVVPDKSTWFGPTNFTPCAVGNHTGTTSLSCPTPNADIQGPGVDVNGNLTMSCDALTCPSLQVAYATIKQTTSYTVSSITYSPPYQFKCLENPVSVNIDDRWSPIISLPFDFCYYGNSYNKCLMGSNGVLTFDTTGNTPGGFSNWQFFNNLPNTSLFRNTIFGVYHDIDPSKGGEVGWELVTLNSGCRALVASWSDIPMYSASCNSIYYTGMIVLYENTNVIDVYIKEKNVCSTWNDGNAIVGIQNAAGNAATVAPGRNALDTNWTVGSTGEAWRFTPNGTAITPIVEWYENTISPTTLIGTGTTLASQCPAVTTTYIAQVKYPVCKIPIPPATQEYAIYTDNAVVTVTGNKIWNGNFSTDWHTAGNWSPSGIPTSANCVIVPVVGNGRYPLISTASDGVGYNLDVKSGASLTVGRATPPPVTVNNLTITDKVVSNGNFTINNNSSLLQINDPAVNTGSINYKRIATGIKGSDYVYWSSPVVGQNMGTFYDTGTAGLKYQWNPTLNNGNGAGGNVSQGIWEGASGLMTTARGYIIRGSTSFGAAASSIATTFTGKPVNGIVPYTVLRGSYTGAPYNGANGVQITNLNDNYNLLGNPYPSSINALKFLQLNAYDATTNPTGQILGNVKLWLHGIDPTYGAANPFYGSYLYNYSANDYLTLNYLGSTTPSVADIIKSGQAFFVQMIDGANGSGTVNFNNSMRFDVGNVPYSNSNFFKNGNNPYSDEVSFERHRIWLDLVDANNLSSGMLLGYAANATNNYDPLFDAPTAVPTFMKLFSMIENDNEVYDIQGRSLPFNVNDEIPIGLKAPTQGNYTFAIAAVDGLFNTQNIYLKDNLLNITHDLKANPYHFTTIAGAIKDRFKVVYTDNALGTIDYTIENNIKVITNQEVSVSSSNLQMESIVVYNVLGQKLITYDNINSNYLILANLHKNNTALFLKIKLQTGETVTKKINY